MKTLSLLLTIIFIVLIIKFKKEKFTSTGKLTDYLNAWNNLNTNISNTFTVHSNNIEMSKDISLPTENGIKFGFPNQTVDYNGHKGSIRMTNGNELHIVGGGDPSQINMYNNVNVRGNLEAVNDLKAPHIYATNFVKIKDGSSGGELCIDGVCITADHLRVLKGEKNINIGVNGRVIDCGKNENNITMCYSNWSKNSAPEWKNMTLNMV